MGPNEKFWAQVGGPFEDIQKWSTDGGSVDSLEERALESRRELDQKFAKLKASNTNFSDPVLSSVNCFHWGGVEVDNAKKVIKFPLNKKLSTYRAHTQAGGKFVSASMQQGTSFWRLADGGKLEVYFGVAVDLELGDYNANAPEGVAFFGPIDGVSKQVAAPSKWDRPGMIMSFFLNRFASYYNEKRLKFPSAKGFLFA